MKAKKFFSILILSIFLIGMASASNGDAGHVQTSEDQANNRVMNGNFVGEQSHKSDQEKAMFTNKIAGSIDNVYSEYSSDELTVYENNNKIHVRSTIHYQRSLKIPWNEITQVEGFKGDNNNGQVLLTHVPDIGIPQSWVYNCFNDGGYAYFDDLPFSEIIIGGALGTYVVTDSSYLETTENINLGYSFDPGMINFINVYVNDFNVTGSVVGFEWNNSNPSPTVRTIDINGETLINYNFSKHPTWGNIKRCTINPDTGNVTYGTNARGDGLDLTGASGPVMVSIPRFYVNYDNSTGNMIYWISPYNLSDYGFETHPAFNQRNGFESEYIYVGAYEASGYLDGTTFKLQSATNKTPVTGGVGYPDLPNVGRLTLDDAELYGNNVGDGFGICNVWTYSAMRLLFYTEAGTLDSQTWLGRGVVDLASGVDFAGKNTGADSVDSNIGTNGTGSGTGTNGQTPVVYRGVENPWGNCWKFVAGINIMNSDGSVRLINPNGTGTPAGTLEAGDYIALPGTVPLTDGYINGIQSDELGALAFIPSANTGGSSTYLCDYFYYPRYNPSSVLFGGRWTSGSYAGVGCQSATDAPSLSYHYLGARLEFIPNITYSDIDINFENPSIKFRGNTNSTYSEPWNSTSDNPILIEYGSLDDGISYILTESEILGSLDLNVTIGYFENTTLVDEKLTDEYYQLSIRFIPGMDYQSSIISFTSDNNAILASDYLTYNFTSTNTNATLTYNSVTREWSITGGQLTEGELDVYNIIAYLNYTTVLDVYSGFGDEHVETYPITGDETNAIGSKYVVSSDSIYSDLTNGSDIWIPAAGMILVVVIILLSGFIIKKIGGYDE